MGYTILDKGSSAFDSMIREFGAVTVMDAKIYDPISNLNQTAEDIVQAYATQPVLANIDSLKIANLTVEGPSKTITGGQYSNPLIKFGKSARLEMQDALGRAEAIQAFGGAILEKTDANGQIKAVHVTEDFAGPKTIIGETFFIERSTGRQVPVKIIIYQVLPDSIFNLTQDAEGDATVFDMNADVLTTVIKTYDKNGGNTTIDHGVFYSILSSTEVSEYYTTAVGADGVITLTKKGNYTVKVDGSDSSLTIAKGAAAKVTVEDAGTVVYSTVIVN